YTPNTFVPFPTHHKSHPRLSYPLLNHHLFAAAPKALLDEHRIDRLIRLFNAGAHDHALAAREAVGPDCNSSLVPSRPLLRRRRLSEHLKVGGRNLGALHQVFRE